MTKMSRLHYWLMCLSVSCFMALVWGGVAWLIKPEHALITALIVFLVMFGMTSRGDEEGE